MSWGCLINFYYISLVTLLNSKQNKSKLIEISGLRFNDIVKFINEQKHQIVLLHKYPIQLRFKD